MLVLNLRWVLFGIWALVLAAAGLGIGLARRRRGERRAALASLPPETKKVLEGAPFGLVLLDGSGAYSYANRYAQRLFDLPAPAGQLPAAGWTEMLALDCRAAHDSAETAGRYRGLELPESFVRWWVTAWGPDEETKWTYALFALDATAQQTAERAARELFSDLSHELRTPIATILTHLQVLGLQDLPAEMRAQSLHLMEVEARRMSRLTHSLLELSRLEAGGQVESRPVDLLPLVEEAVAQMRPPAQEKGVGLSLEADAPLELVIGDAGRLKQVFLNLIDNAVKYVRPGDQVWIGLRQEPGGVACSVCDSGPGIAAAHLPHLTRRFYRGVPEGTGGSGLGLALVKEILQQHQSRLEIESQSEGEPTGTCVRFVLPVLPGEEGAG